MISGALTTEKRLFSGICLLMASWHDYNHLVGNNFSPEIRFSINLR